MMRLQDFLSARLEDGTLQRQLEALPLLPETCNGGTLICGPDRSGRSSLLFHAARALAAEERQACQGLGPTGRGETGLPRSSSRRDVLCLCRRAKLEGCSPLPSPGTSFVDGAFRDVKIKYIENIRDLIR